MSEQVHTTPQTAAADIPATPESTAPETVPNPETNSDGPVEPRRLTLKVDGEQLEVSEDEAIRYAQMGKAAQKRFEDAARMRKEAEDIVAAYRGNIREALKDPENLKAFEDAYAAMLEFESLSPEERQRREEQSELERYREAERRRKEEAEAEEDSRLEQHFAVEYERQFVSALQSANLPRTPAVVKKMAEYVARALDAGIDVSPQDVVGFVRDDMTRDIKATLGGLDEATLFALLGDDVAGKIRKADLARVKGSQTFNKTKAEPTQQKPQKSGPRDLDEFLDGI